MVDVMLVLLIIFMVVAPTLLDGFVAEPPNAANVSDHPRDSSDVTLGIDAGGRYYLNKNPVEASALASQLEAIYGKSAEKRVLYLKADREVEYARVLAAIDTARNHGVVVVGMITHQPTTVTNR
jgi:biopolymer transport protein ExbD